MAFPEKEDTPALLLMVAGAKGAVASTVAVATAVLKAEPHQGLGGLTTAEKFPFLGGLDRIKIGGWDISTEVLPDAVKRHGVLPSSLWEPHAVDLTGLTIRPAPSAGDALEHQVEVIRADIRAFQAEHPDAEPVMVNLLPASCDLGKSRQFETLDQLLTTRATTPPIWPMASLLSWPAYRWSTIRPTPLNLKPSVRRPKSAASPWPGGMVKAVKPILKLCWLRLSRPGPCLSMVGTASISWATRTEKTLWIRTEPAAS